MRVAEDWADAHDTRSELVFVMPSVWGWVWRVGLSLMVFSIALATLPNSAPQPEVLGWGVTFTFVGLVGPNLLTSIRSFRALTTQRAHDQEEEA